MPVLLVYLRTVMLSVMNLVTQEDDARADEGSGSDILEFFDVEDVDVEVEAESVEAKKGDAKNEAQV
jgi:hypothetical protein